MPLHRHSQQTPSFLVGVARLTLFLPLLAIVLAGGFWFLGDYLQYQSHTESLRRHHQQQRQKQLKYQVEWALNHLQQHRHIQREWARRSARSQVMQIRQAVSALLQYMPEEISRSQQQRQIRQFLRTNDWTQEADCFFAIDAQNGRLQVSRGNPQVGQKVPASPSKAFIQENIRLGLQAQGGFNSFTCPSMRNEHGEPNQVIAYMHHVPELNWVIGSGFVEEKLKQQVQQHILEELSLPHNFEAAGKLFILNQNGRVVMDSSALNLRDSSPHGKRVTSLLQQARQGPGYVELNKAATTEQSPQSGSIYMAPMPAWNWYVGATMSGATPSSALKEIHSQKKSEFYEHLLTIGGALLLLGLISGLLARRGTKRIWHEFKRLHHQLQQLVQQDVALQKDAFTYAEFQNLTDLLNQLLQQRRATEQALIDERNLFMAGPTMVLRWRDEPQWPLEYASVNIDNLLGYQDTELEARQASFTALIHPQDRRQVSQEIEQARTRQLAACECSPFRLQHADGSYIWVSASINLEFGDQTQPRLLGYVVDISELKAAQEQIARLAAVVEQATESIVITDLEGTIVYANPYFETSTGYRVEEALGQNPRILKSGHQDEAFYRELWQTIRSGQTWKGTFINKRKDGSIYHEAATIFPIKNDDGVIINYAAVKNDITERVQAEEELKSLNWQLQQATREAQQANAAKSEFLAMMSHEIRTPMNGIIGMNGLLLDTDLSPQQRQYAEIARSSGETLLTLINDILDFSKIEAGKLELEMLDFDLTCAVEDIAEMMAYKAQQKGIELTCFLEPTLPKLLRGDPGRLRQILLNLLSNAIKFTPQEGQIDIQVNWQQQAGNSIKLHLQVTDSGPGVPHEQQQNLFEPFEQGDTSTTRQYGGTGLGLAICKKLVELMGGAIGVESSPGQGATFWFTVQASTIAAAEDGPPAFMQGRHVLLALPNSRHQAYLQTLLEHWGCSVTLAADGSTAQQRWQDGGANISLIAYDAAMPDLTAEAFWNWLQEQALPLPGVLGLHPLGDNGAFTFTDSARLALVAKPVRQQSLFEACQQLLQPEPEQKAPSPAAPDATDARPTELPSARILVAEDNTTNQKVVLAILRKLGYRAEAVANGQEVLEALSQAPFDLVLMDCQMPEMDGYEATRRIRSGNRQDLDAQIPIVALTAHALKGADDDCFAAGMNDYIAKPVMPETLAETLQKWLPHS